MRTCLPQLMMAAVVPWMAGRPAAAQPADGAGPRIPKSHSPPYVSLLPEPGGRPALIIEYPWQVHARPSVEVRLVSGEDPDPTTAAPLYFLKDFLNGPLQATIYKCQDQAVGREVRKPVTERETRFEILARRNSLGRPAVCVAHRFGKEDPSPGTAAVFWPLSGWSINGRLLRLDLPAEYFDRPGNLRVWLLRGATVLWSQEIRWPGTALPGRGGPGQADQPTKQP